MNRVACRAAVLTIVALLLTVVSPTAGFSMADKVKIEVGELVFDALVAGPEDGPVVFMLHGFPQASFEWRHQLPKLASMGFRVIAPNQRGYSPGARPQGVEAYTIPNLVADIIGMADAVGADTFHIVGHDWGAAVAWFVGLMHPDRVLSLVPISVPHPYAFGQALADPEGQQAQMSGYMDVFRADGSEDLFLANDAAMLRGIYGGAGLSPSEIQEYVDLLGTREALGAALNWYRAMNLQTGAGQVTPIAMPTMYVWSTDDVALGREGAELTASFVEGPYRFEILEGVGHWVPEQAAEALNELLQEHFAPFAVGGETASVGSRYEDLVALFEEFRASQGPEMIDGMPDYTAATMSRQHRQLGEYQRRLAALDIASWPVSQKVDYHLVRGEMNGLDFYHRVLRPWSRDPVFYLPTQGGGGPAMAGFTALRRARFPLSTDRLAEFTASLRAVPRLYEQAQGNLVDVPEDLALLALHYYEREASVYGRLAAGLREHHPDLVEDAERARNAVEEYGHWIELNKSRMTGPAGIGIDNYNWWLKNVHLVPYTWEEAQGIVQHEYSRIITFLKLEEHRNRKLPPLEVADTAEKYYQRLDEALAYVVEFLRDEEILTVPDWLDPTDYSDPSEERGPLPENPSIDHKAREREVLPGETHEFIGHMFDYQRAELDNRPIRGVERQYNMDWVRTEGWAVALEELLMVAGVLDERPQRGREIEYLMNASHMSLSLPDFKMHSNEMTLAEARRYCAEIMPYGWSHEDEPMVWFEMESNLRFPAFHTGVVLGKAHFMKLFRDRAMQLGTEFNLREFIDEFLAAGLIPISLTRWEMTGYDDEIKRLTSGS